MVRFISRKILIIQTLKIVCLRFSSVTVLFHPLNFSNALLVKQAFPRLNICNYHSGVVQ